MVSFKLSFRSAGLAIACSSVAICAAPALAEIYNPSKVYRLDFEGATSIAGSSLVDDSVSSFLELQGRGEAKLKGKDPFDHYLQLRVIPSRGACTGHDRAELMFMKDVPMGGKTRYLGFRMMMPVDQPVRTEDGWFYLLQFHQPGKFFMLNLREPSKSGSTTEQHFTLYGYGGAEHYKDTKEAKFTRLVDTYKKDTLNAPFDEIGADLLPGAWHTFVIRFRIDQPDESQGVDPEGGYEKNATVKVWKDRKVMMNARDLPLGYFRTHKDTSTEKDREFDIKLGIYKSCDEDPNQKYVLNLDDVALGDSYWDVNPI